MEDEIKKPEKKIGKVSEYSLFRPTSTNILYEDYPELKTYDELKNLNRYQLLFAWYFACESSPYYKISNNRERCQYALNETYFSNPKKPQLSETEKEQYLSGKFPEKLALAIDKMRKFRVGPRVRARMIAEKSLENLEKILCFDASDETQFANSNGEIDWGKKKSYIDAMSKGMETLPRLISDMESSFGVLKIKNSGQKNNDDDSESFMDQFHDEN